MAHMSKPLLFVHAFLLLVSTTYSLLRVLHGHSTFRNTNQVRVDVPSSLPGIAPAFHPQLTAHCSLLISRGALEPFFIFLCFEVRVLGGQ